MSFRIICLSIALVLAGHAQAQQLPAFYDVSGVAANDVLNIRSKPLATAPILATLQPRARNIEVVGLSENGKWGLINAGETAGYVAMRFLKPQDMPDWAMMGGKLRCGGTEPFWDATFDPSRHEFAFTPMGETTQILPLAQITRSAGRNDVVGLAFQGDGPGYAVIRGAACSDGMSDRAFGINIDLFLRHMAGPMGYSGCCSLLK